MRRRLVSRGAALGVMAGVLAAALLVPARGLAMPLALRAASGTKPALSSAPLGAGGVAAAGIPESSTPLPASPATGTLDAAGDSDRVHSVVLAPGQRLTVSLTASAGTDFDLYLYWPNATELGAFDIAAAAVATSYPDVLSFDAAQAGTYYLDVHAVVGAGDYTLGWTVQPATAAPVISRMWGLTRYETALDISAKAFVDEPSHDVVIACGERFPDALSASGLAGALGCPLLLTRLNALPGGLITELQRLGVADVHIVGGTAAVSPTVEQALEQAGYTTYRYGGIDRYATSAIVAGAVRDLTAEDPRIVFLSRGDLFPDALSVAPLAYQYALPVVLTRPTTFSPAAAAVLADLAPPRIIIAGGTGAVSSAVETAVIEMAYGPDVERVGGINRYATAVEVARFAVREYLATPSDLGLASGMGFADALCGGSSTGARGGLMVLTHDTRLADEARALLVEYSELGLVDSVTVYGGTGAVRQSVEDDVAAVLQ